MHTSNENLLALESFGKFEKHFQQLATAILQITPKLLPYLEAMLEISRKLQKFQTGIHNDHVWIPPFFDEHNLKDVIDTLTGSEAPIVALNRYFLQKQNIDGLLESWLRIVEFRKREDMLRTALIRHLDEDFISSIPLFCIHIESLICRLTKPPKMKERLDEFKGMTDKLDGVNSADSINRNAPDTICQAILRHSDHVDDKLKNIYPNRNSVLHGEDLSYYKNEFASTRLIITLDYISQFFQTEQE